MPRISLRLSVMLLTFILGISLTGIWHILSRPSVQLLKIKGSTSVRQFVVESPRFIRTAIACGFECSSNIYNSSDAEVLSDSTCGYSSPARAKKELQRDLKGVQEIVERAPILDGNGRQISERVVAIFLPDENGKRWVRVMWTDGPQLRSISAPSLELALEFEQRKSRGN